jgi:hypothetical protein
MKYIFLLLLVLGASVARAQKNFVPAIVISHQHDSLRGFIDYRNWRVNPAQISFKQDLSAEEQHFKPTDISGFLILPENELYLSRQVELDVTPQTLDHLMAVYERTYRNDTVFLLNIVKGVYNLYGFTDKGDQIHYVYDSTGLAAKELRLIKSRASDGSNAIATINLYQQQMAFIFADCPAVAKRAARARYSEDALRELFVDYHQCRHPSEKIVVKAKEKAGIRWGLLAGISFNSYSFSGMHFLAEASYKNSVSVLPGLFLDIPVSRNRHQFWGGVEAFYKVVEASGTLNNNNILESWQEQVNLKFSYAHVNLLFRYLYPKGHVKPFASVGWGNAFMLSESKNERYRKGNEDRRQPAIEGPAKHETSFFIGAGLQFKKIQVEARYAGSGGFSPYVSLATSVNSVQGIVRFAF